MLRTFVLLFLLAVTSQGDVRVGTGCGQRPVIGKRIRDGLESCENSWPWMVSLRHKGEHRCGGSLVGDQWVVTAAHCFNASTTAKDYSVMLGEHRLKIKDDYEQLMNVITIILHPRYYGKKMHIYPPDYDIALVKLAKPVKIDNHISTICLAPATLKFNPGDKCETTGWGYITFKEKKKAVALRETTVPLVSRTECNKKESFGGRIRMSNICAGYKQGGPDSCNYDGGGPLACKKNGRYYLTGIVLWGDGCGKPHKYGVYANMELMTSWVKKTMATS